MDGSDMLGFDEWIGYIIFMNIICLQCNGGRAPHGNNLPNAAGDSPTRRGEHARVTMVQGFSTAGRDFPGNTPLLFQTSPARSPNHSLAPPLFYDTYIRNNSNK